MKTFNQLVEEVFDDPFAAASNVERRERGEPDYKERSMSLGLWYAYLTRPDGTRKWVSTQGRFVFKPVAITTEEKLRVMNTLAWLNVKWVKVSE